MYDGNGEKYSAWIPSNNSVEIVNYRFSDGVWTFAFKLFPDPDDISRYIETSETVSNCTGDETTFSFEEFEEDLYFNFTVTRTANLLIGYILGTQTDKPIASIDNGKLPELLNDPAISSFCDLADTNGLENV